MKLTKGKLSKILNKKKQTLKRNKNKKRIDKRKTFRKKKPFNLKNLTLKKWIGGQETDINPLEALEEGKQLKQENSQNIEQNSEQVKETDINPLEAFEEGKQLKQENSQNSEQVKETDINPLEAFEEGKELKQENSQNNEQNNEIITNFSNSSPIENNEINIPETLPEFEENESLFKKENTETENMELKNAIDTIINFVVEKAVTKINNLSNNNSNNDPFQNVENAARIEANN